MFKLIKCIVLFLFLWFLLYFLVGNIKSDLNNKGGVKGVIIEIGREVKDIVNEIKKDSTTIGFCCGKK